MLSDSNHVVLVYCTFLFLYCIFKFVSLISKSHRIATYSPTKAKRRTERTDFKSFIEHGIQWRSVMGNLGYRTSTTFFLQMFILVFYCRKVLFNR